MAGCALFSLCSHHFALVSVKQLWHSMQLATLLQDLQEVLQGCEPMLKTGRGLTK